MIVRLPWPPTGLSPNARNHWAKTAKLKKAYREACAWSAMQQGAKPIHADKLHLTLTFYPPTRRAYDLDNALARCKAGLDGLADALKSLGRVSGRYSDAGEESDSAEALTLEYEPPIG